MAPDGPGIPARDSDAAAPPLLARRQLVPTLAGLMLALFLAALDQTVVGTAMPRIIADLGGLDRFTWVTGAYLVASTTAVPIVGRLSDLYGRKPFYIAGTVIFIIGSALSGLSQTMDQLIVFRAIQGIGGGSLMALAFVTVGDLFPPAERGKYQGFVAAVFGLSSVVGPTLGGFITDTLSWHWVFYVNLPLGVPILFVILFFFPGQRYPGPEHHLDWPGMILLVLTVVPLLVGLSLGGVQYEWASPQIVGLVAFALAMGIALVTVELRTADPIMSPVIYKNRVVSLSLVAIFCTGFGMFGGIVFIPLFFQGVLGASATSSGSFLTPMMLGVVAGAALSGQALSRLGGHYRRQGIAGFAVMGSGMFLISLMTAETSHAVAVLFIVVMGFGMGTTFPTFTIAVQNAVPHHLLGAATSATQFYRSVGGAIGLALLGSLMANRFASGLSESLSDEVKQALPPGRLADLSTNPQALVNPDALSALQDGLGQSGGPDLAGQLLQTLRETLASAIGDVFLVSVVAVAVALAVTSFLKEMPLRGREYYSEGEAAPRAPGPR